MAHEVRTYVSETVICGKTVEGWMGGILDLIEWEVRVGPYEIVIHDWGEDHCRVTGHKPFHWHLCDNRQRWPSPVEEGWSDTLEDAVAAVEKALRDNYEGRRQALQERVRKLDAELKEVGVWFRGAEVQPWHDRIGV